MSNSKKDYYISNDLEAFEIFEQIKKQTDEMSTSEGSNYLLKNLSNPTNLTNPQIKGDIKKKFGRTLKQNIKKSLSTNRINRKNLPKTKSETNIIKEYLFSPNKKLKHLLENSLEDKKKEKEKDIDINIDKEKINSLINKSKINTARNFMKDNAIGKQKIFLNPIWDKLLSARNFHKKDKEIRINIGNKNYVRNYIDNTNEIRNLKYLIKNKVERFERLKEIKDSELLMVERTLNAIEKSKKYIENSYYKNYISYLIFLNRTVEKEKNKSFELINDKFKLIKEINKLNNMLEKLFEEKYNILLWISLQIQVKEKLIKLPKYYFYILEENDYYKTYIYKNKSDLHKKNEKEKEKISVSQKEREKILHYRNNIIYDSIDKFLEPYSILENRWFVHLKKNQIIQKEIEELKKEYISEKEYLDTQDENMKRKINEKSNLLQNLKSEYQKLKSQIPKKKKMIYSKSSLTLLDINRSNLITNEIYNNTKNFSPKNNTNRNQVLFSFSNYSNKNLFEEIINLFNIIKQNNFIEFDYHKFKKKYNYDSLLPIMNYIERVTYLLIEEKKHYYNNPKLKAIYKKKEEKIVKENRKIRYFYILKMKDLKQKEKIKKIQERINKDVFISRKTADYSYFNKANRLNKNNENNEKMSKKNKHNFEDFMFDL